MAKPGTVPGPRLVRLRPDRRNFAARNALVHRIRTEFREMRGLSLTPRQAARLFGIPQDACTRILSSLAEEGLLRLTSDSRYVVRGNP